MENWDDLRFFVAVAREGSLLAAARRLRVNPATVGRRIDRLESALGQRLFFRSHSGYTLTEDGERIRRHAQALENEIFDLDRAAARGGDAVGTVTVTLTESLAEAFLVPLLPAFRDRHPGVRIDLILDDRSLNLSRREADMALRLARPRQEGLKLRKIATLGFGLFAAPEYLERHGTPRSPGQLAAHHVITWMDDYAGLAPIVWWHRVAPQASALRSNAPGCRRAAANAGLGIALLPCVLAQRDSCLRRLLPELEIPALDVWLVVHRDLARHPRVRAFLDFVAGQAQTHAESLRGVPAAPTTRP